MIEYINYFGNLERFYENNNWTKDPLKDGKIQIIFLFIEQQYPECKTLDFR